MPKNQLIDHRNKSHFQLIVTNVLHGAAAFIIDVGVAASCHVFVIATGVYSPLESIATLVANNLAREAVAALVLTVAFYDAFFETALCNQSTISFKVLSVDDGLMVIGKRIPIFLSIRHGG